MSIGQKVVTAYFVVAYGLPMAGNALLGDSLRSSYDILPLTPGSVAVLGAVYVLFLALSWYNVPVLPQTDLPLVTGVARRVGEVYRRWRLPIAAAALILAVAYASAGFSRYRYLSEGISETGSLLLLLMNAMNMIITADLLHALFMEHGAELRILSSRYVENNLLALTLLITATGTASMFLALTALAYSLMPRAFRRLTFVRRGHWDVKRAALTAVSAVTLPVVFFAAWLSGEAIKVSSHGLAAFDKSVILTAGQQVLDRLAGGAGFARGYVLYLVERLSVYYYSFLLTASRSWEELQHGATSVLSFPLKTFLFRLDYLLGSPLGAARPETGSIMVLNYQFLTVGPVSLREGSSPGLVASFNYVFPFPLNVVFCALFLRWVARAITVTVEKSKDETLSVVGALLLLAFVQSVFQSPFDLLMVFDEGVIYVLVLFCLYQTRASREVVRRHRERGILPAFPGGPAGRLPVQGS